MKRSERLHRGKQDSKSRDRECQRAGLPEWSGLLERARTSSLDLFNFGY